MPAPLFLSPFKVPALPVNNLRETPFYKVKRGVNRTGGGGV